MDPEPTICSSIRHILFAFGQEMPRLQNQITRYYQFKLLINDKLVEIEKAKRRKEMRRERKLKRKLERLRDEQEANKENTKKVKRMQDDE